MPPHIPRRYLSIVWLPEFHWYRMGLQLVCWWFSWCFRCCCWVRNVGFRLFVCSLVDLGSFIVILLRRRIYFWKSIRRIFSFHFSFFLIVPLDFLLSFLWEFTPSFLNVRLQMNQSDISSLVLLFYTNQVTVKALLQI